MRIEQIGKKQWEIRPDNPSQYKAIVTTDIFGDGSIMLWLYDGGHFTHTHRVYEKQGWLSAISFAIDWLESHELAGGGGE